MRTICLILCLALLCGGAAADRVAMGRYVEVPIALPEAGALAFAHANGALYFVDGSGETLYARTAGDWDWNPSGHDEQTSPNRGGVNGLAVGADGTVYLSSGWAMVNEEGHHYIERIANGQSERIQLDRKLDAGSDALVLCALPSGELLGLGDVEAYRFSADGETLKRYAVSGGTSMAVHGGEMAVCSLRDSLITVLDIDTGKVLRTLTLPGAASYGAIGYDASGALYYVCPGGLYQVNAGSEMLVQIADGRLMTAGKPSVIPQALLFDQAGNPVIAYWQDGATSLIAYRYDEHVATEPGTVLSVFTLYDSATLRECASKFQQQYPDVMVDITLALPGGTAVTRDDAIRALNAALLAGKGPDVLVLDGLPVNSYVEKGVLMDLSPAVQPLMDSGAIRKNIAGAFQEGDVIPAVPTRFLLPSLWGDVAGMNTLSDMAAWAQAHPDALPSYARDPAPLIGTFYLSCAPAWFDGAGRLEETKIAAFLQAMQAMRQGWANQAQYADGEAGTAQWDWNPYQPSDGDQTDEESRGCNNMAEGRQGQLPFLLRGLDSTTWPNGAMAAAGQGGFAPLPGQARGCFVPALLLGASKGGQNNDTALQFIQFALGEDCQSADLSEGFQVNAQALEQAQARGHTLFDAMYSGTWSTTWLSPRQQVALRSMIDALDTPVVPDFTLYEMLVRESAPFFEGAMDAQQAAQSVCAKANAYLSE